MEFSIWGKRSYSRIADRLPAQLLLKMKLTTFIIVACLQVSARTSYSQTITFSGKNVPLQAIFTSIEKQTGLSFFFNYALVKDAKPVTLDLHEVPLEDALHEALKDAGLDFYRHGKTIFIVKKSGVVAIMDAGSMDTPLARLVEVKGKVTDPQGQPLSGASVTVKRENQGTITDEKGTFTLHNVISDAILQISYTGYQKIELPLNGQGSVSVVMKVANTVLDQAQVIAYGTTTQRFNVGNSTTVKSEDIEKQPVSNPLLALEGKVPGLFITQNTGVTNGQLTVRVQGQNSISSGNDPLYVIDGVPYISQLPLVGSEGIISGGNPLSFINSSDIESISVLKDADATAIYGSRAANGAILITTKKGKPGKTNLNINAQQGWGKVTRKLDMLNTRQYLDMRYEAYRNDNINWMSPSVVANDLKIWDTTRYTDWQKTLIGGTAQYSNFNVNIAGGNLNTQYLLGGTFHRETTIFPGSSSDEKGSVHFNLNTISPDQKLTMQISINYMSDKDQLPLSDLTPMSLRLAPDAPSLYNPDGNLNWMLNPAGTSTWTNPFVSILYSTYSNKTNALVGNTILSYVILPGLKILGSGGYTSLQTNTYSPTPLESTAPENRASTPLKANYGNRSITSWIVEPQLEYKKVLGKGIFESLIGCTVYQNSYNTQTVAGSGYSSDLLLQNVSSATSLSGSSNYTIYNYNALFGRLNYNWEDKYIIDLTARRDGSSRFGPQNQFHNFASAGSAWIFSQEHYILKKIPFLSFGKLKASYGTTGNDQIGDYSYLSSYNTNSGGLVAYQNSAGLSVSNIANPYLQWEETQKLQFGIELGFWKNRILLNSTYSRNRSSNELLPYTLPTITGFTSITENFPATVQNTSWEFLINTINVKTKTVNWTSSLNLTIPQNKLVAFPNLAASNYANSLAIGHPISLVKLAHFLGLNPQSGLYMAADFHGNPTYSPTIADRTVLVTTLPEFYGGFQNTISWKGVQLDFLLQFVEQVGANTFYFATGNAPGAPSSNQQVTVLNRWKMPGDVAPIARFGNNIVPYVINTDAAYSDAASYIRLRNLSLSWQLPAMWLRNGRIQNCRLYVQGENLLTFTRFQGGLDPENQSTTALPPLRVLTVGIQVQL